MPPIALVCLALICSFAARAEFATVEEVRSHQHETLAMQVIEVEIETPDLIELLPVADSALGQPQLTMAPGQVHGGRRMAKIHRQDLIQQGHHPLYRIWQPAWDYAHKNERQGPMKPEDLGEAAKWLTTAPWSNEPKAEAPFYAMIPGVVFPSDDRMRWQDRTLFAVELCPYADDGKHYVLYAGGRVDRVPVDAELLARLGVTLRPLYPPELQEETGPMRYQLYAVVAGEGKWSFSLRDVRSGKTETLELVPDHAQPAGAEIFTTWAQLRARGWAEQRQLAAGTALDVWAGRSQALYGVGAEIRRRRNRGNQATMLNVLGGRAAIAETLQMQVIGAGHGNEPTDISIAELEGVQVKSHPYAEMLGDAPGGSLPLANYVPADRFFLYFVRPSAMQAFFERGEAFIADAGAMSVGNSLHYGVNDRYFARLGVDGPWVKAMLKSRAVSEIGLVFSDLFVLDGTDISVIMRVPRLALFQPLLRLVGVQGLSEDNIVAKDLDGGKQAFWARRGDLLFLSSHPDEMKRVLALYAADGADSLGQSAEFRYMLTQLPLTDKTRAYAYFSDPFIRRLVGPEVKLAQLRRLRARSQLETVSAAALLHQADGHPETPTLESLQALGYLPVTPDDLTLDEDLRAHSPSYGHIGDLATLLEQPVTHVSKSEAEAYKAYVQNYSRFWRQFFDPIALRLDDIGPRELELEVFILPLIDSSIYRSLREFLSDEEGHDLRVPVFTPEPVALLSANLREAFWSDVMEGIAKFAAKGGLDTRLFDELGPSIHFALMDGDPVINVGSGDLLGGMGGFRGRGGEMFMVPVMLSALTRPCRLLVEVQDADLVRRALHYSAGSRLHGEWSETFELAQVGDGDEWVCNITLFDVLKLRFGLRVEGNFLVITNLPWAQSPKWQGDQPALSTAALHVSPAAGVQQLPGLFAAACEQERLTAFQGAAFLTPLMQAGAPDVKTALARHHQLFGFFPRHPEGGSWTWQEGRLRSSRFGDVKRPRQPDYDEGDHDFGLFREIAELSLSMQFEDEGLRTRLRWQLRR